MAETPMQRDAETTNRSELLYRQAAKTRRTIRVLTRKSASPRVFRFSPAPGPPPLRSRTEPISVIRARSARPRHPPVPVFAIRDAGPSSGTLSTTAGRRGRRKELHAEGRRHGNGVVVGSSRIPGLAIPSTPIAGRGQRSGLRTLGANDFTAKDAKTRRPNWSDQDAGIACRPKADTDYAGTGLTAGPLRLLRPCQTDRSAAGQTEEHLPPTKHPEGVPFSLLLAQRRSPRARSRSA